jgi:D-inositol-3-phosphate glycosyltransferase
VSRFAIATVIPQALKEQAHEAIWRPSMVIYSPIESGPIEAEIINRLRGIARYVVFTETAKEIVVDGIARAQEQCGPIDFPVPEIIPHGVDTALFRPIVSLPSDANAARKVTRQRLSLDDSEHADAFIVLNANRNLPKKRMDITIEGFAKFAKNKPANVKLYLHTQIEDQGWNVVILCRRHDVLDRLILSTGDDGPPGVSGEKLNLIYNACDVGINTSMNEGWGLVSFEHAAARRAQIVPGNPCLKALWQNSALVLDPIATQTNLGTHSHAYPVSADDLCAALERLYTDARFRAEMAERAFQHATQERYAWSTISAQWSRPFQEVSLLSPSKR